jgi:hypothetical protein
MAIIDRKQHPSKPIKQPNLYHNVSNSILADANYESVLALVIIIEAIKLSELMSAQLGPTVTTIYLPALAAPVAVEAPGVEEAEAEAEAGLKAGKLNPL